MNDINISYSSMSCYLLCKRKWKLQFIDKVPIDAPQLRIGRVCHDVINKNLIGDLKLSDIKQYVTDNICSSVGDIYCKMEEELYHKELTITNLDKIKNKDKYSFQFILENEVAAIKNAMKELDDSQYTEIDNVISIIGGDSIPKLRDKLNLDKNLYKSEYEIKFEYNYITFKGIIDILIEPDDINIAHGNDTVKIIDFKTSRNIRYVDWFQFEFYMFLVAYKYKNIDKIRIPNKFMFMIYFLRYHITKYIYKSIKDINEIYDKIMFLAYKMINETNFEPSKNRFCKWCNFKDSCSIRIE